MNKIYLNSCDCGACPYLKERQWRIDQFCTDALDSGLYEAVLVQGFRRSGLSFYKNSCPGCSLCIPIRIATDTFRLSKSQRHVRNINSDIVFSTASASFSEERFNLYEHYVIVRHESTGQLDAAESYRQFLIENPLGNPGLISDYRMPDGRLAANGYIDVLPDGLSSVYFAFDPEFARRSLGVFSVLKELELAASLGKRWYYLGFWVPGSPKMDYKANYRPFELALDGEWKYFENRGEALSVLNEVRAE